MTIVANCPSIACAYNNPTGICGAGRIELGDPEDDHVVCECGNHNEVEDVIICKTFKRK